MLLILKIGKKKTVKLVDTNKVQVEERGLIRQVAGFPLMQVEKSGEQGYEGLLILYEIHVVLFNLAVYQHINGTVWVLMYFLLPVHLVSRPKKDSHNLSKLYFSSVSNHVYNSSTAVSLNCYYKKHRHAMCQFLFYTKHCIDTNELFTHFHCCLKTLYSCCFVHGTKLSVTTHIQRQYLES